MSNTASNKQRQSAKKRAEREARIRAAKRRQRQRLGIVLGVLAIAGIAIAWAATRSSDSAGEGSFYAGGGANCGDVSYDSTAEPGGTYESPPPLQIDCDKAYSARIVTSQGEIVVDLFDNVAPLTVNNFVALARDGFFDGIAFHRVIPDFMIQTGDPLSKDGDPANDGTGGPGYRFQDEFDRHKNFEVPYRLAMANSGPGTNGSQFFITVEPTEHLNQRHTVFGIVTEGADVAEAISTVATSEGDRPVEPVLIERIEITETVVEPTTEAS